MHITFNTILPKRQINQNYNKLNTSRNMHQCTQSDSVSFGRTKTNDLIKKDIISYQNELIKKRVTLESRINENLSDKEKIKRANIHLPDLETIKSLPKNIVKDGDEIFLKDVKTGKKVKAQIIDIIPFSNPKEYKKISDAIETQWLPYASEHNLLDEVLYRNKAIKKRHACIKLPPEGLYTTIWANGKLQGIVSIIVYGDKKALIKKANTAPWNLGKNPELKGVGIALHARQSSLMLENNSFPLKTYSHLDKKSVGFEYVGEHKFYGKPMPPTYHQYKDGALEFLDNFEKFQNSKDMKFKSQSD